MKKSLSALALFSALVLGLMACSTPPPESNEAPVEEYKPRVRGEVRTFTLSNGVTFTALVKNGIVVVEGDMILGPVDKVEALVRSGIMPLSNSCDYRDNECDRWPGRTVYYEINSNDRLFREKVLAAINHVESKTNLDFRARDSGERIVYNKVDDGTCAAEVGNNQAWYSGVPDVECDPSAFGVGSFVHETLHALGYAHEQGRDDRDDYVNILWDNIRDGREHNFEKADSAIAWIFNFFPIGPYDYGSIMHYPCGAFRKSRGLQTIVPTQPGVTCNDLGQRRGMSDGDVLGVLYIYRPELTLSLPTDPVPRNQRLLVSAAGRDERETNAVSPYLKFYLDGTPMHRDDSRSTTGSIVPLEFAAGTQPVRVEVEILGEVLASASGTVTLSNVEPVVEITQPLGSGPYCQNETITLRALASDVDTAPYFESGNVSDRVDWIYDPDPTDAIAGVRFATDTPTTSYPLSHTGTVRFLAEVDDADGARASDYVDVVVDPCTNTPPVVTITNPSGDLNVWVDGNDANGWYYSITLQGTASDAEDGPLTGSWYTDRGDVQPGGPASGEQLLGNGNTLPVKLYAKAGAAVTEHVISFRVTDSDGNTRTVTVTITVNQLI